MTSFKIAQQFQGVSKFVMALAQLSIVSVLVRLMLVMLLHQYGLRYDLGDLCMSFMLL
jgi:hypothetical protein